MDYLYAFRQCHQKFFLTKMMCHKKLIPFKNHYRKFEKIGSWGLRVLTPQKATPKDKDLGLDEPYLKTS